MYFLYSLMLTRVQRANLMAKNPNKTRLSVMRKRKIESIYKEGIKREPGLYVHLSPTVEIAHKVGSRHGTPTHLTLSVSRWLLTASIILFGKRYKTTRS